ncbi:unnamed protein product [Gordionus sp. m RMFG-2023]
MERMMMGVPEACRSEQGGEDWNAAELGESGSQAMVECSVEAGEVAEIDPERSEPGGPLEREQEEISETEALRELAEGGLLPEECLKGQEGWNVLDEDWTIGSEELGTLDDAANGAEWPGTFGDFLDCILSEAEQEKENYF